MYKYFQRTFLILFLGFILFSCSEEKASTTQICVLIDVSDKRFQNQNYVEENVPKLLSLMDLSEQTGGFSGGEIKLSLINEVSDSKSKTIKIETGETGMMGENPLNRKDKVVKFQNQLKQSFAELLEQANWGTDASKIYQKVSRELIKMKKSEADKKYLIIYSDMLENSSLFSFYGANWKTDIEKMMEEPEKTLENLAKKGPALPDLSEFEIFVIPSRTSENDEKINLSEQLWQILFETRGATVSFNSGLQI
jgi:hypothetical protein